MLNFSIKLNYIAEHDNIMKQLYPLCAFYFLAGTPSDQRANKCWDLHWVSWGFKDQVLSNKTFFLDLLHLLFYVLLVIKDYLFKLACMCVLNILPALFFIYYRLTVNGVRVSSRCVSHNVCLQLVCVSVSASILSVVCVSAKASEEE